MEQPQGYPVAAAMNTTISIFTAFFAWISIKDAQVIMGMIASSVAIISGGFAIRYYIISTNKVKRDQETKYYNKKRRL